MAHWSETPGASFIDHQVGPLLAEVDGWLDYCETPDQRKERAYDIAETIRVLALNVRAMGRGDEIW